MMGLASELIGRVRGSLSRLREFLWLSRAVSQSRRLPETVRGAARAALAHAANLAELAALCSGKDPGLATSLYRDACLSLINVQRMQSGEAAPNLAGEDLLRSLPPDLAFDQLPSAFERSSSGRELVGGNLDELARFYSSIEHRLDGQLIALRSPAELALLRVARLAVVGALLGSIAFLVASSSGKNLALNRPAKASSRAFDTKPGGAVDGVIYNQLGFHSSNDGDPWLAIDLGRLVRVQRVKLFGRNDCCPDQSVPLALEVSPDGSNYRQIAKLTEPFSQVEPWSVDLGGAEARFVRVHTLRRSVLVLSEVQVFGEER